MEKNCAVSSISTQNGAIVLELPKWVCNTPDLDSEWAREYKQKMEKNQVSFKEKPIQSKLKY